MKPHPRRRGLQQTAALVAALSMSALSPFSAQAQSKPWPQERPIQIQIGQPAGYSPDRMTRALAEELSRELGQSVIVVNKAAGGGRPMLQALKGTAPDGYTLANVFWNQMVAWPALFSDLPYKPADDFKYVGIWSSGPQVLVTTPESGIKSFAELVQRAKEASVPLQFGTFGSTTPGRIFFELVKEQAKIRMEAVPFKAGDAVLALFRKDVPVVIGGLSDVSEQIIAGKLVLLATTGDARLSAFPNAPTFKELGISGLEQGVWAGLIAPPDLPDEIAERLRNAVKRVVYRADVVAQRERVGLLPLHITGDEMQAMIRNEMALWGKTIRAANIRID